MFLHVDRLRRWFLHGGPSEMNEAKSFRFSTTEATSWISSKQNFYFLLFFSYLQKTVKKKYFFEEFPSFWNFCMDFTGWSSGYSYYGTRSKTLCFVYFRWSFMEKSSAQATYLLFEELCLPEIFVYTNCVKSTKKCFHVS